MPSSRSEAMTSHASRRAAGSKPVVGSSRNSSSGSPISASATSRRRCWPPESLPARRSACALEPDQRERLVDGPRRGVVAGEQLERLAHGQQSRALRGSCRTTPIRARQRAPARAGSSPSTLTSPPSRVAEALEDLDGGGLARAVGAEEARSTSPGADLEVEAAHRLDVPVGLAEVADGDDGLGHAQASYRPPRPRSTSVGRDPQVVEREAHDLAEGRPGDEPAVDLALRLVDHHRHQHARAVGGREADERGDVLGRPSSRP